VFWGDYTGEVYDNVLKKFDCRILISCHYSLNYSAHLISHHSFSFSVLCTYAASNILHTQFIATYNLSYEKQVELDIDIKFYNSGTTKHNGISTVEQG